MQKSILLTVCMVLTIGFLSINIPAQANPPTRPPQQAYEFGRLIRLAECQGSARVLVRSRNIAEREQLIEQLAQFRVEVIARQDYTPYFVTATMRATAAALAFMRDSYLVTHASENIIPLTRAELFQRLARRAQCEGSIRVIVGVYSVTLTEMDQLLRQLAQFQVEIITGFGSGGIYVAMRANAAAIEFMRDSPLVANIQEDGLLFPQTITTPPIRTPEELAYFQKAIETAQRNGTVRVIVGLNVSFTPEGYLTPEQRAAQRAAISLAQDELLRQLVPYQASLITRFELVPYITLDADATALIFMRDSELVLNVRENGVAYPTKSKKKRKFVKNAGS
jgi:hypothetical protein